MSDKKLTKIDLTDDDIFNYKEQPFEWMTEQYGRAEFVICPIWKGSSIKEVFIHPAQQPDAKHYYHIKGNWKGISFGDLLFNYDTIKGVQSKLNSPKVWMTMWCKEHKCQSFRLYVPRNSNSFFVSTGLEKFCINWR
jgi:hypothetical protein